MKPNLHRIKWGVRAVLAVTFAVSVAANILHAQPNAISRAFSGWAPLCLLAAIELVAKVPMTRRASSAARVAAMVAIAFIAAWVSYWQQVSVLRRYGETGHGSQYMLPLTVDGLIVIGSVSLVEIAGRIRAARTDLPEPPAARIPGLLSRGDPEGLCTAQPAPAFVAGVGPGDERQPAAASPMLAPRPPAPPRRHPPGWIAEVRERAAIRAQQPQHNTVKYPGRGAQKIRADVPKAAQREQAWRMCAEGKTVAEIRAQFNGDGPSKRTVEYWTQELRDLPMEARAGKLAELLALVGTSATTTPTPPDPGSDT